MTGIRVISHLTELFSGVAQIVYGEYTGTDFPGFRPPAPDAVQRAQGYSEMFPVFKKKFSDYLSGFKQRGKGIAVFGAGGRTCTFLNLLGLGSYIDMVCDDQPEKQGKLLPGSHIRVAPSSELYEKRSAIGLCLLGVNAENEDKVIAKNQYFEAAGGTFLSIHPPSPRLVPVWREVCETIPKQFKPTL